MKSDRNSFPKTFLSFGWIALFKALVGACLIACMMFGAAWFFSVPLESGSLKPDADELKTLEALRDQSIDPEHVLRIQVDVDYAQGDAAAWYPKEQSPILDELVESGELPPVAERVGDEPLVLRGVEGEGKYGGSMYKLNDLGGWRNSPTGLLRWSPQGYPLVPNVAKSWTANDDMTSFTFQLRKGMKWSDGHPFTSADIVYWWNEENLDKVISPGGPYTMFVHHGEPMKVEAKGPYAVQFTFSAPYALFPERLASYPGIGESPKHFLKPFHPVTGAKELIQQVMERHNLINERAVYGFVRSRIERPSLAPWIIRTERMTPPATYVRNPYYWAVDEQGRQLPYVDRIVLNSKSMDMLTISAAQGDVTMQGRYIRTKDYTMLMRQREQYGYQVYHYLNGDGSNWGVALNLNRRYEPGNEEAKQKAELLGDKRFRQALSLAINRQAIVDAVYSGLCTPSQIQLPPSSPYYYADMVDVYAPFDPDKANRLLDECGLTARDADGYRRFPDGSPLLFDLNYCPFTGEGPGQFLVDDWRKAGVNTRMRGQDRTIFYVEKSAGLHDMTIWGGYGDFMPLLDPRYYIPFSGESNFAVKYGEWYGAGGMNRTDTAQVRGMKPPEDSPLWEGLLAYEKIKQTASLEERREVFRRILDLANENVYIINLFSALPQLAVVKDGFRNVPAKGIYSWPFLSPQNLGLETWFWDEPEMSQMAWDDTREELSRVKPVRELLGEPAEVADSAATVVAEAPAGSKLRAVLGGVIRWGILICLGLMVALIAVRSPYVARRILIMIPMLFIISMISFIVIELPPGDAINSKIMQLQEQGGVVDQSEIDDLKSMFRTDEPMWKRYFWWIGLDWFTSFDRKDQGLLQGNMGRSMLDLNPVNQKVGDRLLFTFLISLGTILFTWAVALPIGIYSAVKQYSLFDYIFTIAGFIGMCIPGFLLALLLMFGAETFLGLSVSGLFSPEYAAQSGWTLGKTLDLLKHIWLPVLVMGVTGTAGMIRVMRANLLDELQKPYVTTARAKGVRPMRLLFKYPVRVALNPFISGIGGIFPQLISGGAIVAIVMSLPTVGPMQLDAVMQQDMYLAGSMLMLLSLLSVLGTLVSDLLLAAMDPRIRFQGGGK
ncbi:ABC transporter permease subunit [Candidatus Sumerlaeota bacterium]|nr:ABC transporter permease subunit [Candidatus Sumerlaeota bacterium]